MHSWKFRLFVILLAVLPAAAQMRTVSALAADVDFKFSVGNHTFHPGHYEFIPKGPGLLAMRDSRARVVGTFLTRVIPTTPGQGKARLVFEKKKNRARLASVWMKDNEQALEILGEEAAIPQRQTDPPPPLEVLELLMRGDSIRPFIERDKR